jgi:hypothetical protein
MPRPTSSDDLCALAPAQPGLGWPGLEVLILDELNISLVNADSTCRAAARAAVVACLECWSYAVQRREEWADVAPVAVKIHARWAAQAGVELSSLIRCYTRSRDLAWQAICEQCAQMESEDSWVVAQQVWAAGKSLLECIQDAVELAHKEELEVMQQTPQQMKARLVRRLLRGDGSVEAHMISHDFDGQHLGLAAKGADAERAVAMLAELSGCRLYSLPEQGGVVSAWLRVGRQISRGDIERWLPAASYPGLSLGIGRPADGVQGFCETSRLASEALEVAERRSLRIVCHADVELDALLLRDQELARSLVETYIDPLEPALLKLLQAHSQAGWNESATARVLGVSRNYVRQRLKSAWSEDGQHWAERRLSVELALRAVDLEIDQRPPSSYHNGQVA